jgi:hypothetical protein
LARPDLGVQVPAGQPDGLWRLLLQGPDGHGPPWQVQVLDDGGGAVDHPQAVAGVGAQDHHVADREAPIPDHQPLGAELAGLGAEALADGVELVDLGSSVGVDHRLLAGLVGLPPVGDEGAVAVVAGLERSDAVVLGVGGDRLLKVPGPHVVDRPLLPGFDLPPVDGEFRCAQPQAEAAEAAASSDGGELAVVADQHHLRAGPVGMAEQRGELAGGDHGRLVHHQHRPAFQLCPALLEVQQQPVDGAGISEAFLGQADGGDPSRSAAVDLVAVQLERLPGQPKSPGLAPIRPGPPRRRRRRRRG